MITRIDLRETLKDKLGVELRPDMILGACNPALAHEALQLEKKVGTMLPCNVVVQQTGRYETKIAVIDPGPSMQAIDNPALLVAAGRVRDKLRRVIDRIEWQPRTGGVS